MKKPRTKINIAFLFFFLIINLCIKGQNTSKTYFSKPGNVVWVTLVSYAVLQTSVHLLHHIVPNVLVITDKPLDKIKVRSIIEKNSGFHLIQAFQENVDIFTDDEQNYIQVKYKYKSDKTYNKYKHRIRLISKRYYKSPIPFRGGLPLKKEPVKKNYPRKTAKALLTQIKDGLAGL